MNLKDEELIDIYDKVSNLKFNYRNILNLPSNVTFGIELEFKDLNLCTLAGHYPKTNWIIDTDCSVTTNISGEYNQNYGGEMSSPVFKDNIKSWMDIRDKCLTLQKLGAKIDESTSTHINIGANLFNDDPERVKVFLKMWQLYEHIIYLFSYGYSNRGRTKIETYANPIGIRLNELKKDFKDYNNYAIFTNYFKNRWLKKENAINLYLNDINGNRVEFRTPNGTFDFAIIQNYINFFSKLLLKVSKDELDTELLDYKLKAKKKETYNFKSFNKRDINSAIDLCDTIYDNELDKLMFLKQYIKDFDEKEKNYVLK